MIFPFSFVFVVSFYVSALAGFNYCLFFFSLRALYRSIRWCLLKTALTPTLILFCLGYPPRISLIPS